MDHYQFPHITDIGQVLKVIKDKPKFIIKEGDRYTVINYMTADNNTFPRVLDPGPECDPFESYDYDHAILRECRGIIFGVDGSVIARRYHKFFNVGEKQETFLENMDFSRSHLIFEKLDGSMITPIPIAIPGKGSHRFGYTLRWGTKMGITEVSMGAEDFVVSHPNYVDFAQVMISEGKTPIFEWCSRKQRIVIDYPKDRLVLTAVRNNITGVYMSYEEMWQCGCDWNIEVVSILPEEKIVNGEEFIAGVREIEDAEGYVVRFDDGHMTKVKGEWYCRIHRAKESIINEKRVVEMIVNEKVDDVLPFLLQHDRDCLIAYNTDFVNGLIATVNDIWFVYKENYAKYNGDKKAFAIASASKDSVEMPQTVRSTIFAVWDKNDFGEVVNHIYAFIRKNLGSSTKVNSVRWLWGGYSWANYIELQDEEHVGF